MSEKHLASTPTTLDHTHLEYTISHPWISYDEEKWVLELDDGAIEVITAAIEEMKAKLQNQWAGESQPSEKVWIPSVLVDAWITAETIKVDKKGKVHWILGGILKLVRKNKVVPQDKLDKVIAKIPDSQKRGEIWVKVWARMLPVPLLVWENSTFESVRKWFEVRLRSAGIMDKTIKVSSGH